MNMTTQRQERPIVKEFASFSKEGSTPSLVPTCGGDDILSIQKHRQRHALGSLPICAHS